MYLQIYTLNEYADFILEGFLDKNEKTPSRRKGFKQTVITNTMD